MTVRALCKLLHFLPLMRSRRLMFLYWQPFWTSCLKRTVYRALIGQIWPKGHLMLQWNIGRLIKLVPCSCSTDYGRRQQLLIAVVATCQVQPAETDLFLFLSKIGSASFDDPFCYSCFMFIFVMLSCCSLVVTCWESSGGSRTTYAGGAW